MTTKALTTDPNAKGPKVILRCDNGHESVITMTEGADASDAIWLDTYCRLSQEMANDIHGGCNWQDPPGSPRCGAKVTVTWTPDPDATIRTSRPPQDGE